MPIRPRLTGNQLLILDTAARRKDGAVLPLPSDVDLKGRARTIVLKSLLDRGLIERIPGDANATAEQGDQAINFRITKEGKAALKAAKAKKPRSSAKPPPKPTQSTKTARLIDKLSKPNGASIEALMATLGWQAHSVRAALSRLRKSGARITHDRTTDGKSIYRIEMEAK